MSNPTPFNNDQPTLALTELLVEQGVYPTQGDSHSDPGGVPLGALRIFAGNFNFSSSTEMADGQAKQINTNQALFSLLGFNFGGNGQTNFKIPDAQGHVFVGTGQGTALSNEIQGQATGADSVTLNLSQMPASIGGSNAAFDNHQASLGFNYMINTGGHAPDSSMDFVGMVVPTAANFADQGYLLAQGQTLLIADYPALFNAIGTIYGGDGTTTFALPDLRGRTIIGSNGQYPVGTYVGQENVSVTTAELPPSAGGHGDAIDNHQPSLAMTYLICVSGIFPSQNGGIDYSRPFIGEIVAFAGTTAPPGWMIAAGQSLQINTNQALFSLLGFTYGGNGTTTFKVPDLQDHAVVNAGTSAGLGTINVGMSYGNDNITLLASNIIDAVPHLTGVAGSLSGLEHVFENIAGSATASDGNLDLLNSGSGDYAGASLTLARHGGASAEDTFGFDTAGASFTVSGGNLQSAGHTFASFTNTGGVLTITFNSSAAIATTALVNNLIEHITYAHQGNGSPASVVLDLALSDGNSGAQGAGATPAIDTHSIAVNTMAAMPAASDFNGDSHSDILWRNDNSAASIWDSGQIGNAHIISNAGDVPNNWHIAGRGDFDGNGHIDILWQNDNAAISIWDNGQIGGAHIISGAGGVASSWHIAGTGDFDGNGHSDILWQNDNGALSIWDNGQIGSAHVISGAGTVASSWHIAGTGDFDGNGHSDILWRNDDASVWIWDNGQSAGGHIVSGPGVVASSRHIAGTGDFDGNGHSDILWQNDNGMVSIWDNGQIGSAHVIAGAGVVASSWHIAGTGDFDGNGHSDILWRNDNGMVSIWDNGQIGSAHLIANAGDVASSWHIV
jgi:microcystin-dependent protein